MDEDLALALRLADLADSISMRSFRGKDLAVHTKPDQTPVTEVDRAVEQAVRHRIRAERPRDVVVGEEFGGLEAEVPGSRRWIVDPIDGTKNYVRGIPVWATLLAMEEGGDLRVAVVSAPALGQRWWAVRGEGAFTGPIGASGRDHPDREDAAGRRLAVSRVSSLDGSHVLFGGLRGWRKAGMLDGLIALALRAARARGFGDFWMHMLVAEGSADVAAEPEVSVWDLAPIMLIVEEAGGRFTDLAGRATPSGGSALSTNGALHDLALQTLVGK